MHTSDMGNVLTLGVNNSKIVRINKTKFSGYWFYINAMYNKIREVFKSALVYL